MAIDARLKKLEQILSENKDKLNLIFKTEQGTYEYNGKTILEQDIEKIKGIKLVFIDDYGEEEL